MFTFTEENVDISYDNVDIISKRLGKEFQKPSLVGLTRGTELK